MDDFMLDAKRLQALGILLNELITNSMKHAFAGKKGGRISVELRSSDGKARLSVRDDGIGLPAGMDGSCSRGIGLSLVEALAAQLSATLRIDRSGGTGVHLEFSL